MFVDQQWTDLDIDGSEPTMRKVKMVRRASGGIMGRVVGLGADQYRAERFARGGWQAVGTFPDVMAAALAIEGGEQP